MKAVERYSIGQSSRRSSAKSDYFNWEIWIENGEKSITEIESVEYLLHSTFPDRLRSSSDVTTKFKLKSRGWGEFTIRVIIYEKSGEKIFLNHWLTLRNKYTTANKESKDKADNKVSKKKQTSSISTQKKAIPQSKNIFARDPKLARDPKPPPPEIVEERNKARAKRSKKMRSSSDRERTKTVYLSYANADTRLAQNIQLELGNLGLNTISPSNMPPRTTIATFIEESIASSDAVVKIEPDYENPWQNQEIEIANGAAKKTFLIDKSVKTSLYEDTINSSLNEDIRNIADQIKNLK